MIADANEIDLLREVLLAVADLGPIDRAAEAVAARLNRGEAEVADALLVLDGERLIHACDATTTADYDPEAPGWRRVVVLTMSPGGAAAVDLCRDRAAWDDACRRVRGLTGVTELRTVFLALRTRAAQAVGTDSGRSGSRTE